MADRVLISPGVFTSEKTLNFITRQIGVTTLGISGEFPKGPAFQPIFVQSYGEHVSFFGGLNPERFPGNNYPKYEGGYIAKSYLSQSNQLWVTRVLGLSGYDAKNAWAIVVDAGADDSQKVLTASSYDSTYAEPTNPFATIQYTTGGDFVALGTSFSDPGLQQAFDDNNQNVIEFFNDFVGLNAGEGVISTKTLYIPDPSDNTMFIGYDLVLEVVSNTSTSGGGTVVIKADGGSGLNGVKVYEAPKFTEVQDTVIAVLRSRAAYNGDEVIQPYVNLGSVDIDNTFTEAMTNPLGDFKIVGTTSASSEAAVYNSTLDIYESAPFDYLVSFDKFKKNFIGKAVGKDIIDSQKGPLFIEELYTETLYKLISENKVYGVKLALQPITNLYNYKEQYRPAITPWVLSELRGTNVLRLFRFITISDGDSANKDIKISIQNIRPDLGEFDVVIRKINDNDFRPIVLESFPKCTLDKKKANYICNKIGTFDGEYPTISKYVVLEMADGDLTEAFPAGFDGFLQREYKSGSTVLKRPQVSFKTEYETMEKKRKVYLGLSDTTGFDYDYFTYKGLKTDSTHWTLKTNGFHLDQDANGATVEFFVKDQNGNYVKMVEPFVAFVGNAEFRTEEGLQNTDYEKVAARKFTFAPYGGFDGWDIYRRERTNGDTYRFDGFKSQKGILSGAFKSKPTSEGDFGTTSDYYAYLEASLTFKNTELLNINIFTSPGLDVINQPSLVDDVIDMIEEKRKDSIYIVTTPDIDADGEAYAPEDIAQDLEGEFDSNYTASYWPWIQLKDEENSVYTWIPPTAEIVKAMAYTDNVAFPWYAAAGLNRGTTNAFQARLALNLDQRDSLYEGRLNPMATFIDNGIIILGNKTLQIADTPLNRVGVRRLLLQTRKLIAAIGARLLFEPNDEVVRAQFESLVNPILENIRKERGLIDFRVVVDKSVEALERAELVAEILIKPTKALEYVSIGFTLTNQGANFDDI